MKPVLPIDSNLVCNPENVRISRRHQQPPMPKMLNLTGKKPGQRVSKKTLFDDGGVPGTRYAVYACMTRFGRIVWFVDDAETPCRCCGRMPEIIRQADSFEEAVAGL